MMGQQWNLSVQYRLNNSTTAQLGYVGEHGTHLLSFADAQQNQLVTASGAVAHPGQVGTVIPTGYLGGNAVLKTGYAGWTDSNANQSYNALQAVLNKRMGGGLEGQLAYTYSKCITDSTGFFGTGTWGAGNGSQVPLILPGPQNIYDQRAERGPCYWDQTHIFSSYVTYALPIGHGKKIGNNLNSVVNAVVGNWELGNIATFHSGNAVTPIIGGFRDPSGTGGAGGLFDVFRPNCSGAPSYPQKTVNATGGNPGFIQWWDPSTFSLPANNSFGTCSNGVLRGPRYADVDLSVHKDFPITEGKRLEFRSEFINLFNHPILNFAPGTGSFSLNSTQFGQINSSQGERNIQFGLKFYY